MSGLIITGGMAGNGGSVVNSDWNPQPDWWDIEKIFKKDPDPNKRFILLYIDANISDVFSYGNPNAYYKTSDGVTYTGSDTHTWDVSKDKPCSLGYKTRYVIVYSSDSNVTCNIASSSNPVIYAYIGNYSNLTSFIAGGNIYMNANIILESVKFDNITFSGNKIPDNAFNYCYNLKKVNIPAGVTSIGNSAFSYCYGLAQVDIPSGVKSIGNSAFSYCHGLTQVNIPLGVTSIGSSAFEYSYNIRNVNIPPGVTSIGNYAFRNLLSLKSIYIHKSMSTFTLFNGCMALHSIIIEDGWIGEFNNPSFVMSISSAINFINNLGITDTPLTIRIINLSKLSPQQIAVATNKGYTLIT